MCHAQGRNVDVALGALQQHIGTSGKLSGELRTSAHGRTGLWIRRQRLQKHLSNETVYLRVSMVIFYFTNTDAYRNIDTISSFSKVIAESKITRPPYRGIKIKNNVLS